MLRGAGVHGSRTRSVRSMLYAPGDDSHKLGRAIASTADAVVCDWEDAVEAGRKESARQITSDVVSSLPDAERTRVFVRVNGLDSGRFYADLAVALALGVGGVIVPKVESELELAAAGGAARVRAELAGRSEGTEIWGIIETALGLVRCREIAAHASGYLSGILFGQVDLSRDLGASWATVPAALMAAKVQVVAAARAAGLAQPLDGPWTNVRSLDGLEDSCLESRAMGFAGRVVIHPSHLECVNRVYSFVDEGSLQWARRTVQGFERAQREGLAAVAIDGEMVDYPIYYRAQEMLLRAESYKSVSKRIAEEAADGPG